MYNNRLGWRISNALSGQVHELAPKSDFNIKFINYFNAHFWCERFNFRKCKSLPSTNDEVPYSLLKIFQLPNAHEFMSIFST